MLCHHFQIQQHSAGRLLHAALLVRGCLLTCLGAKHPNQALDGSNLFVSTQRHAQAQATAFSKA